MGGRLWILAVHSGDCSATVELVLTFRARASSDLIISRHLAGKARVSSSHYSTTTSTMVCLLRMPTIITMILQIHVPPCSDPCSRAPYSQHRPCAIFASQSSRA